MRYGFLRVVSGTLVIICAAAPGAATVVQTGGSNLHPGAKIGKAPHLTPRTIDTGDARGQIIVRGPSGCSTYGSYSFAGGGYYNYPGGYAAGILSGTYGNACDSYTIVGGGYDNIIGGDGNAYDATIAGGSSNEIEGGANAAIGGGASNLISDSIPYNNADWSTIGGGESNLLVSPLSFIGAGFNNTVVSPPFTVSDGTSAFIGAGASNYISSDFAAITGGYGNTNSGEYAAIGGGQSNTDSAADAFIGGGQGNTINSNGAVGGPTGAQYATIAGGLFNLVKAAVFSGARYGFIGGGHSNTLSAFNGVIGGGQGNIATGDDATVPGGLSNDAAGNASFAAGNGSRALHNGSFVWSDDAPAARTLASTAPNQFLVRASGGVYLYSSPTLASGVRLAPGSGSWSTLSDRAAKSAVARVDGARILARVAALPVSEWSYTAQGTAIRHIGPMAQDFRAAFGLGEDDRHISSVDEEGVAIAAIKALQTEVADKDRQIAELRQTQRRTFAQLQARLDAVEARLAQTDRPAVATQTATTSTTY